jgi:hypothetical protein
LPLLRNINMELWKGLCTSRTHEECAFCPLLQDMPELKQFHT